MSPARNVKNPCFSWSVPAGCTRYQPASSETFRTSSQGRKDRGKTASICGCVPGVAHPCPTQPLFWVQWVFSPPSQRIWLQPDDRSSCIWSPRSGVRVIAGGGGPPGFWRPGTPGNGEKNGEPRQRRETGSQMLPKIAIHANSPRDVLSRLETMVAMANLGVPDSATRRQIASAIDLVVHLGRLSDGTRKLLSIAEITGMEGEVISMQEMFVFKPVGVGPNGDVMGKFLATGIRPHFSERLISAGIHLPAEMFS